VYPPVRKERTRLRRAYLVGLLVISQATPSSVWIGLAVAAPFAALHFVASGYLAKERTLVTAGPYRFCRNPFYLANFFMDLGFGISATGLTLGIPAALLLLYIPYFYGRVIRRRVRNEEAKLRSLFGDAYDKYVQRVPRYLPNPFSDVGPRGRFCFENLRRNGEIPRAVNNVFLVPAMLAARISKDTLFGAGTALPEATVWFQVTAAGLLAAFLLQMLLKAWEE
jgi:protein-S-isoprenylcysteine O-methyltransferase Ste14